MEIDFIKRHKLFNLRKIHLNYILNNYYFVDEYLINDAIATLSGKLSAQGSIGLMIFRITTADTDWERL